jgi:hypothetical protein
MTVTAQNLFIGGQAVAAQTFIACCFLSFLVLHSRYLRVTEAKEDQC